MLRIHPFHKALNHSAIKTDNGIAICCNANLHTIWSLSNYSTFKIHYLCSEKSRCMSRKFQPLTVKKVVHETHDAFSIYFKNPETEEFHYKPGQYLILQAEVEGKPLRRAFSLSTSPFLDEDLAVTIKCIENGKMSNFLHSNLKSGDTLQVMPPQGNFTADIDSGNAHHYILFGGGSGITPLMSIIRSVLAEEEGSRISLLYANRDEKSIIFQETLQKLEKTYGNRLRIVHSLDEATEESKALKGKLTEDRIVSFVKDAGDELPRKYYLCGPGGMMEVVKSALNKAGISNDLINQEHFTASLPETSAEKEANPDKFDESMSDKRPEKAKVTVILDGEEHTLEVGPNETILEAAIDAGIDPPFACQEGICTTCQAKLHKGRVHMDEDEGLTDDEIEEGYVLTCQSHPLTEIVKVEYE